MMKKLWKVKRRRVIIYIYMKEQSFEKAITF